MTDNKIVELVPTSVGENYEIKVEKVLKGALEENLKTVVIIGVDQEDKFFLASDSNFFKTYFLLGEAMTKMTTEEFFHHP